MEYFVGPVCVSVIAAAEAAPSASESIEKFETGSGLSELASSLTEE